MKTASITAKHQLTGARTGLLKELYLFRKNAELFLLSLPGVLFLLVFAYFPMVGIIIAFKDFRYDLGIFGSQWVGLQNFKFFFTSDDALRITRNTILYNVGFIVIGTITALAFAIMLNEISRRWSKIHQTILFLPYFASWVVVSYVVYAFLDPQHGMMNHILQMMGFGTVNWYQEPKYWPVIINVVNLWKGVGFGTLVYYAGIMSIDSSYYEAAEIDGATKFQMMRSITLPMLTPLVCILLILSVGSIFRADFGLFYFVPNDSSFLYPATDVIDTYVFRALRSLGDMSMSAAVGLYQSVVGLILVLSTNYIVKKINEENSLW